MIRTIKSWSELVMCSFVASRYTCLPDMEITATHCVSIIHLCLPVNTTVYYDSKAPSKN